ncbi:hypothetical protein FHY26_003398 [Xanthomonas campestris]|jgi:hypothetical protein
MRIALAIDAFSSSAIKFAAATDSVVVLGA